VGEAEAEHLAVVAEFGDFFPAHAAARDRLREPGCAVDEHRRLKHSAFEFEPKRDLLLVGLRRVQRDGERPVLGQPAARAHPRVELRDLQVFEFERARHARPIHLPAGGPVEAGDAPERPLDLCPEAAVGREQKREFGVEAADAGRALGDDAVLEAPQPLVADRRADARDCFRGRWRALGRRRRERGDEHECEPENSFRLPLHAP
jgi:hypothetical protein